MKAKTTAGVIKIDLESGQRKDFYILSGVIFVLTFVYFLFIANHILSFQEEQFLFLFSGGYLKTFISKPGGILEYAGKFLMQFNALPAAGALIVASVLSLAGIMTFKALKLLNRESAIILPLSLLPSCLLMLMQNQYYHTMEYNLGFICITTYFIITFRYRKYFLQFILFPLLFYISGAYALIFIGAEIIYALCWKNGFQRFSGPAILLSVAALTFFLFKYYLFLVPSRSLLTFPLPIVKEPFHRIFSIILVLYFVFLPLLSYSGVFRKAKQRVIRYAGVVSGGILIFLSVLFLAGMYNPSLANVMKIQASAYKSKWDDVINLNEKAPSENLISQYFYNTALAEKGQLCEKLFTAGQNFGTKALILPWGDQYLERGAYFFYTTGLVNEAYRWAFEEMVVYGMRPHNLLMLIKTNLINGNERLAEKYIDILKETAFYRDEALKFEELLSGKDSQDSELSEIARIKPEKDFFIYMDSPEDNLPMLFESNPLNKRAFEYMMSWLLLEKDVETVISNIHLMKGMGYTSIPRYIEEAVMIYYNSQGAIPDLGGLTLSPATLARFNQYFNTYLSARNNPATFQKTMNEKFGDTFWYYFHFYK